MTAFLLALAPFLPLKWSSDRELARSRDSWILAVLAIGGIWALRPSAVWLSLMATWYLLNWRSMNLTPSAVTWAAIGASWFLLRSVPGWAWAWVPYVWTAALLFHVAVLVRQRLRTGQRRPWGLLASPPCAAMVLALLGPFALATHVILAPPLVVGLWLTSSWLAILATLAGAAILYPSWPLAVTLAVTVGFIAYEYSRPESKGYRHAWLDIMPRGRSLDGLTIRLNVYPVIWHVWRLEGWKAWIKGRGPYTLNPAMQRWSFRYATPLPEGDAFNDALQHVHEYGLLGLAALVAFCLPVVLHLRWGDPWSAAWITGCVLAMGHWPMRWPTTGLVWLAVSARLA